MKASPFEPWAGQLFLIAGALALAVWCIYWDLRRRMGASGRQDAGSPASAGAPIECTWRLESGIGLLAMAWLLDYLSQGWGDWLKAAGYGAFVAGAVLIASHVAMRLSTASGETRGE